MAVPYPAGSWFGVARGATAGGFAGRPVKPARHAGWPGESCGFPRTGRPEVMRGGGQGQPPRMTCPGAGSLAARPLPPRLTGSRDAPSRSPPSVAGAPRPGPGSEPSKLGLGGAQEHVERAELPRSRTGVGDLGDGVLPGALARAAHDDQGSPCPISTEIDAPPSRGRRARRRRSPTETIATIVLGPAPPDGVAVPGDAVAHVAVVTAPGRHERLAELRAGSGPTAPCRPN